MVQCQSPASLAAAAAAAFPDAKLSEIGHAEAKEAGSLLAKEGLTFDVAYTSVLTRAITTCWHVLEATDRCWIPVHKSWRLNERHYGALTGLNKAETAAKHGADQVKIWRRSYDIPPPPVDDDSPENPKNDVRYADVDPALLPACESLKLTLERVLPEWDASIAPMIKSGKRVLIAAHGNSLRALVKYLDDVSDDEITGLNIPTGVPLVYELDADLKPVSHRYLGNAEEVAAKAAAVAAQAAGK